MYNMYSCTKCVKADVCSKKKEFEAIKNAAEHLIAGTDDTNTMSIVQSINWIELSVRCKKFLAPPNTRDGWDTGRGGADE